MLFFRNPEEKLRDEAENIFRNFQKSNRPSGLSYIKDNTTEGLFEVMQEDILAASESAQVTVMQLEHELVEIHEEGTKYFASVRYQAVVRERDNGQENNTDIDEVWFFVYQSGKWLLKGIDQV